MRVIAWALLLCGCLLLTSGRDPERRVIEVSTAEELVAAFREPLENVTVKLAPGNYTYSPANIYVPEWGCNSTQTDTLTGGVLVSGRNVRLVGPERDEAILDLGADVFIYFNDCVDCEIERVTITTQARDTVPKNTGAAILARRSSVRVRNCVITCILPTSGLIAFHDGIVGAQQAILDIQFSEMAGLWRGIALTDDARAVIAHNRIQGHAGIWVGCAGEAIMERNLLHDLAVGVQLTERASLTFRSNIVEEVYAKGVKGTPAAGRGLGRVRVEKNVFFRCGSAAIVMRADGDQKATQNLIVETGMGNRPIESAIVILGGESRAVLRKNTLYGNRVSNESLDRDVPREIFWRARRSWTRTYRNTPVGVDGRHKFHESAFLSRYGRWYD